jgi:serine protease Do
MLGLLPLGLGAGEAEKAPPPRETMQVAVFAKSSPESIEDLQAIEQHVKKLAEQVIPRTVAVQIGGAQGSGVIISKDGYVLTAGHVSGRPGRKVTFTLHDGKRVNGISLGRNSAIDSGLLQITDKPPNGEWNFVEMGSSGELKPGQWCLATGHPGGFQSGRTPVVRLGRVLESNKTVVHTDCTLVGGDSGGPLFDMDGKVIGIHSRISRELTSNFHVPVNTYRDTWDRLVKSEEWGDPPVIGIRGDDVKEGCKIAEIFPGLPAEKAGLKVGDIITKCEGEKVSTLAELVKIIGKKRVGEEITVEYLRDGQTETKKMKVVSRSG